MIEGARQLPIQHITIRVPWHDNGWQGTFCRNPCNNTSCTILPRIADGRNDTMKQTMPEKALKGWIRTICHPVWMNMEPSWHHFHNRS